MTQITAEIMVKAGVMQGWRRQAGAIAFGLGLAMPMAASAGTPAIVPLCASCHGNQGISASPVIPNLAGQKQGYLAGALNDYKSGQRQGGSAGMMVGVAKNLSDADIAALSAYYASLKSN